MHVLYAREQVNNVEMPVFLPLCIIHDRVAAYCMTEWIPYGT